MVKDEIYGEESRGNPNQWRQLPLDLLAMIYKNMSINLKELISLVSLVCHSWYAATLDPLLWKTLDMRLLADAHLIHPLKEHHLPLWKKNVTILKAIVDRSGGNATRIIFSINCLPSDEDLIYISKRSRRLKELTLPNWSLVTNDGVAEVFGNWGELEYLATCVQPQGWTKMKCKLHSCVCQNDLDIDLVCFLLQLGLSCKNLRKLKLFSCLRTPEAYVISTYLPQLRSLDLSLSSLSETALSILLNSCCNKGLTALNISHCYLIKEVDDNESLVVRFGRAISDQDLQQQAISVVQTFHCCPRQSQDSVFACSICAFGALGFAHFEEMRLYWLYEGHGHYQNTRKIVPHVCRIPFYVYTCLTGDSERFEQEVKMYKTNMRLAE